LIGEHHAEIVLVDYFPLNDGEVRRVILHLKELAEHPEDHHPNKMLALPTSECRGPLWDWELDGSID